MGRYGLFLSALLPDIPFEREFSLAAHTTVGVGGTADMFAPRTAGELLSLVRLCERCHVRFYPLGGGSNVLPCDGVFSGMVICTSAFDRLAAEGETLTAECGVGVGKLLQFCRKRGLVGLEFLAGIPARVGGLVCMNAGTKAGHVADFIESVTVAQGGKICTLSRSACRFGVKKSLFQEIPCVVLSVRFRLNRGTSEEVQARIAAALESRAGLPAGRSMGCVFKNPAPDLSAGQLIDQSGCKGWRVGGAIVSETHANFMLNAGGATEADFRTLIERVKTRVARCTGIRLEEEIRYMQ